MTKVNYNSTIASFVGLNHTEEVPTELIDRHQIHSFTETGYGMKQPLKNLIEEYDDTKIEKVSFTDEMAGVFRFKLSTGDSLAYNKTNHKLVIVREGKA